MCLNFHDGAHGCQEQPRGSQYGIRGSGGRMKHLHHPEKGVLSVTLCSVLCKIMSVWILKIFVTQNFKNILASLQNCAVSLDKKVWRCQRFLNQCQPYSMKLSMKTSPLSSPVCALLSALKSKTSAANWHGKHVKLKGYFYPNSKAQGRGQSPFLKASPEGKAFKGQITQLFPIGEI